MKCKKTSIEKDHILGCACIYHAECIAYLVKQTEGETFCKRSECDFFKKNKKKKKYKMSFMEKEQAYLAVKRR